MSVMPSEPSVPTDGERGRTETRLVGPWFSLKGLYLNRRQVRPGISGSSDSWEVLGRTLRVTGVLLHHLPRRRWSPSLW